MKNFSWLDLIFRTKDSSATILIRILVSIVFIPEGIQKLVFSNILGSGRFMHIGIPFADLMGPFVGVIEVTCGLLVLLGLLTRVACIPLVMTMIVAILATKIPILLGENWWIFRVQVLPRYGFWSMMHEIRADTSMFFAMLYLLIRGSGRWSFDYCIHEAFHKQTHKITKKR